MLCFRFLFVLIVSHKVRTKYQRRGASINNTSIWIGSSAQELGDPRDSVRRVHPETKERSNFLADLAVRSFPFFFFLWVCFSCSVSEFSFSAHDSHGESSLASAAPPHASIWVELWCLANLCGNAGVPAFGDRNMDGGELTAVLLHATE